MLQHFCLKNLQNTEKLLGLNLTVLHTCSSSQPCLPEAGGKGGGGRGGEGGGDLTVLTPHMKLQSREAVQTESTCEQILFQILCLIPPRHLIVFVETSGLT